MMIVMKPTATEEEVQAVIDRVESVGARAHPIRGEEVTVIGAIGDREHVARLELEGAPGVDQVVPILKPYKLASAQITHGERDRARHRRAQGRRRALRADRRARARSSRASRCSRPRASSSDAGATMFRGGAYKPRTSPYAFQGLGPGGPAAARRGQGARPACRSSPS